MATQNPAILKSLANLQWRERDLIAQREMESNKKSVALIEARLSEIRYAMALVELAS
jgi:hypothetical protein